MKTIKTAAFRDVLVVILFSTVIALIACGSSPPKPDAAMIKAQAAVTQAQNADTRQYAAVDLNNATTKLQAAQDAETKGNYKQAKYLAEEAQVDAQLAMAKAQAAKAEEAATQIRQGNKVLQNQVNQPSNLPPSQGRHTQSQGELP
ncbi:MAG: DUF4398 domain-containing protein [Gammaproteobacteria bacterium]